METDKQKALSAALKQIDQAFGKGSVMRLGEKPVVEIEAISTGSLSLDIALGIGASPKDASLKSMARKARARHFGAH